MGWGRLILAATVVATAGVVAAVHYSQKQDRARMFEGVLRDVERQRSKQEQRNQ